MSIQAVILKQEAETAFANEEWEAGLSLLKQAILADESDLVLIEKTIDISLELENPEEASFLLDIYKEQIDTPNLLYWYYHARTERLQGQLLEALESIQTAIALADTTKDELVMRSVRANIYDQLQNYEAAILDYEFVLAVDDEWKTGHYAYAWALLNHKQYAGSEQQFLQIQEVMHEQPDYYYGLGLSLFFQQKYTDAIEAFTSAIALEPEDVNAYYHRGLTYYESATAPYQCTLAINDFEMVLSLVPEHALATIRIADSYYKMQAYDKAIESYQHVIELHPDWSYGYLSLGWSYYYLAETEAGYEPAIVAFQQVLDLEKESQDEAHSGMAHCLFKQEKYEQSIAILDTLLEKNTDWSRGYAIRGWATYLGYETVAKYEEAVTFFTKAITLQDDNNYARRGRAFTYQMLNEYEAALVDFQALDNEIYEDSIAWIKGWLGNLDDAIALYQHAIEQDPETADLYHEIAIMYQKNGMYSEAIRCYEKMLILHERSCSIGNYADMYMRGEGVPQASEKAYELYLQAYELQKNEEYPCGCITAKLLHYYLQGDSVETYQEAILTLLVEAEETNNTNGQFLLLHAYMQYFGIIVEKNVAKAKELIKLCVSYHNDAHAWYVYAALMQDEMITEQMHEKIAKYRFREQTWVLEQIDANIASGTFEFFYPMR